MFIRSLVVLSLLVPVLNAQNIPDPVRPPMPDTLFIRMVTPDRDTVPSFGARLAIAGCTLPTARAFLNGIETRVYPSGAFVGLVPVAPGANPLHVMVRSASGDSVAENFVLTRREPLRDAPHDTLVIDDAMMEPSRDLLLTAGDVLEVRFKGSPGWEASFRIPGVQSGIPMRELPEKEANGLHGVYIGRYIVKSEDETKEAQIVFKLRKSFWSSETAPTTAKVTITSRDLPRVAEVVGERPFLNAGLGADRLGGAKLGFLVPGVHLEITGKAGRQYRVRLSESMDAWIPDNFVKLLPPDTPLPRSLTGTITTAGTDSADVVTLSLSRRLPYTSEQLVHPAAIAVDVYGATSNTNWITQQLSAKNLESVRWTQVEADHYRLLIMLRSAYHWGYDIDYAGTMMRIRVRRPPVISSPDSVLAGMLIAVDAGHGGDAYGAIGATGAREMDANLSIARHLGSALKARGARVVMTRTDNEGPTMNDRLNTILGSRAQILVSIHCNAGGDNSDPLGARGNSCYYRHIGFKPLADAVYSRVLETGVAQFGEVGGFNFSLNGPTQLPNVLVETAFLSHPEDEMLILDDGFRTAIAEKVATGLEDFVREAANRK